MMSVGLARLSAIRTLIGSNKYSFLDCKGNCYARAFHNSLQISSIGFSKNFAILRAVVMQTSKLCSAREIKLAWTPEPFETSRTVKLRFVRKWRMWQFKPHFP